MSVIFFVLFCFNPTALLIITAFQHISSSKCIKVQSGETILSFSSVRGFYT